MSSLPAPTVGSLLKRHRRAAGLTQEALAERAQISVDTISDLERNINLRPRTDTIDRLADALHLAPTERTHLHQVARGLPPLGEAAVVTHRASAASASLPPLVGREQELARLARHLAGDGPPLLLLAGEPGIGKSRLLSEGVQQAQAAGWRVLEGGCHRRSGQEPFTPLLSALTGSLRQAAPAVLRTHLEGCAWLVRLLPELVETRLVPVPSWTLPPEQERRLLFAAVARYLANSAGPAGTLLVLDDLQWAGADALDLLTSLLREPGEPPLRVVGAYRSTEVRPPDPLLVLLADLASAGLAEEARLGPLDRAEASALLQSILAAREDADETLREQLLERTGGVPYFLVSCAEALRVSAETRRAIQDVPWNVAQSIGQRVASLPPAAQALLGVAAVVGRETPGTVLLALVDQPTAETVTALEALERARLLVAGAAGRYQFPHDLVREVVLAELSAVRRARLHGRVAEVLEQVPERRQAGHAAELAWHWQEAGNVERALPHTLLAGDQAEELYAHQDAVRHYQTARDLARELGDQWQEAAALEKLSRTMRFLGRFYQALEVLEQVLVLYQATGDVEGQGRVLARLGHLHVHAGTPEAGVARVQPLVASLCASGLSLGGQAALFAALSRLYNAMALASGTIALNSEALSAAEQAEVLAQQAQDEHLLGQARVWRGTALWIVEHEEKGAQVLKDTLPLLEASGDLEALYVALYNLSDFYQNRGEYDLALAATERGLAIAERVGAPDAIALQKQKRGDLGFALGRWKQARQDLVQVATFLGDERRLWPLVLSQPTLGFLLLAQGQAEAAAEQLQRALAEGSDHPVSLFLTSCAVAYQDLEEGRPEAARARLDPFLDHTPLRAGDRAWMQHLLGWASVELGDLTRAQTLLAEASTLTTAHVPRWVVLGVQHSQARLALRQRRGKEAEQVLTEALALSQAMHTPYDEAQTLYLCGLLHLQQGETQLTRERLEAALAILHHLGERLYAERVEQLLAGLES